MAKRRKKARKSRRKSRKIVCVLTRRGKKVCGKPIRKARRRRRRK